MTDKKEEWEIGYSRENPATPQKTETVDFTKSETLVGQMLDGRFLIEKDLTDAGADEGGIGLVFLAQDLKLMGKQTVVKILQKNALKNKDLLRKFQHEKEALIRLDHPAIVRILDSGELTDGNPFMVMEFIEGFSLRRKMRDEGKLPFDFAAHLIETVTDALTVAHSKKILHRDIKPENIMLTPMEAGFERVRLIDFGIARVEDSVLAPATQVQRGIGTILYIAPEQLTGKMEQTPAVDIYSFGIVIYEMLTGELPFKPQSVVNMFELQKAGVKVLPSKLRPDLPPKAEQILLSALEFNAADRPQNARAFGKDLANALREKILADSERTTKDFTLKPTEDFSKITEQELAKTVSAEDLKSVETENAPAKTQPSIVRETNFPPINLPQPERKKSKTPIFAALFGILILAAAVPLGWILWKNAEKTPEKQTLANNPTNTAQNNNPSTPVSREIIYFLNVQKMRGGKAFEEPFKSSGQEIFETGYKFAVNLTANADGFVYLFNEGTNENEFNILFPTPKRNDGAADVKANQAIETGQNTFGGTRGTETVWIIWTKEKLNELEDARTDAFANQGTVKDKEKSRQLREFVQKYGTEKLESNKDTANRQTVLKGKGDVIVYKLELEHR